jgi:hypothetical protein
VRSLDLIEKLRKAMAEWKNVKKEASLAPVEGLKWTLL